MDFEDRYGDLGDEPEQMASPEASVEDGSVIVCGRDMRDFLEEAVRYLISRN